MWTLTPQKKKKTVLVWAGWVDVVSWGWWGGWDESSFITRYWIQRRICCTRLHPFYWAGHHDLFPHTHCWRLLVKGKSSCANLELNRSSVSFNFSRPPIGSFLLKYRTAVTQTRGLFARMRQTHKDQRFKVEWLERQMRTLCRNNNPR